MTRRISTDPFEKPKGVDLLIRPSAPQEAQEESLLLKKKEVTPENDAHTDAPMTSLEASGSVRETKVSRSKVGRPRKNPVRHGVGENLPYGLRRATFIVDENVLNEIKKMSFDKRLPLKEIVTEALKDWIEKNKNEGGK